MVQSTSDIFRHEETEMLSDELLGRAGTEVIKS